MTRVVGILAISFALAATRTEATPRVPPLLSVHAIIISTPSDWSIVIGKTGGAMIGVSSDPTSFVAVPEGSFDFDQVYRALVAVLQQRPQKKASFKLTFLGSDFRSGPTRYTSSAPTIGSIFDHARDCLRSSRDQLDHFMRPRAYELETIWESRPPLSTNSPNHVMERTADRCTLRF
jgi:hypothetical protein